MKDIHRTSSYVTMYNRVHQNFGSYVYALNSLQSCVGGVDRNVRIAMGQRFGCDIHSTVFAEHAGPLHLRRLLLQRFTHPAYVYSVLLIFGAGDFKDDDQGPNQQEGLPNFRVPPSHIIMRLLYSPWRGSHRSPQWKPQCLDTRNHGFWGFEIRPLLVHLPEHAGHHSVSALGNICRHVKIITGCPLFCRSYQDNLMSVTGLISQIPGWMLV